MSYIRVIVLCVCAFAVSNASYSQKSVLVKGLLQTAKSMFVKSVVAKAPVKSYSKSIAKSISKEMAKKGVRVGLEEVFQSGGKNATKVALEVGMDKVVKSMPKMAQQPLKDMRSSLYCKSSPANVSVLSNVLNKRAMNEARKHLNEDGVQILSKDLARHPELAQTLIHHPSYMSSYAMAINTPYRVVPSALKQLKQMEYRQTSDVRKGLNAALRNADNAKDIYDLYSGCDNKAINITMDNIVEVNASPSAMGGMRLPLMANMAYKLGSQQFKTDREGKVVGVVMQNVNKSVVKGKLMEDDNIISASLGGVQNSINTLPNGFQINKGQKAKFEKEVLGLVKKGKVLDIKVDIVYSPRTNQPSSIIYNVYEGNELLIEKMFF